MHRPGIATVSGDCIVLDGTTIEEVRDRHARTLTLVVGQLNDAQTQYEEKALADAQPTAERQSHHEKEVRAVADDIRFE